MAVETLEFLEQVLSGLRARYASGDKSVEKKLRAVSAKVDQLRLTQEYQQKRPNQPSIAQTFSKLLKQRRRSCCR